jgi:hypothetical protein
MSGTVENLCRAMAPWVTRHSAVIRISNGNGGLDIASATCVRIQGRFFLATARHNVADIPSKTRLAVTPAEGEFGSEDSVPILRFGYPEDESIDVAWIELDYSAAESAGLESIELSQLGPGVPLNPDHLYLAAGAQAATKRVSRGPSSTLVIELKFSSCMSEPFESATVDGLRLTYSGKVVRSDGSISEHDPPHGMSGGGLWSVTHEQSSSLWVPDRCRLLGIVSTYSSKGGFLRCTGIEQWISLICKSDPQLDRVIREFAATMKATMS